ncbi:glycerophosphodiester phosphodiesterase [Schaalia sp. 19OD2882]|uniref:glycerophosphodiester phosphodiesterase family protein n=1 Tax=Schaalia sp. 19OD2882 TaxID=2794089 RepID=UPI001C1EEDDD|nr:glycerophosphodiester phosphodiesterase family protein [Schaalia sp. 19OD2882]QWW20329.1 glycerophosphodiester phosphodiesterase [Schaalia sp. 19OD2882]
MYPVTGVRGPLVLAHRGGGDEHPENSPAAFAAMRGLGVRHIETDAHLSKDGVVVVNHDATVERTYDGKGAIGDLMWSELRDLVGTDGERMMTLSEALLTHPDMYFNIDAKSDAVAEPLLRVIEDHDAFDRVLVASFSERRLARLRALAGPMLTTSIGTTAVALLVGAAQTVSDATAWGVPGPKQGVRAVQVPVRQGFLRIVDRRFVATAHRAGLAVHVWTVNDEATMRELVGLGVDGIVTDRPSLAKDVLVDMGLWREVPPPSRTPSTWTAPKD